MKQLNILASSSNAGTSLEKVPESGESLSSINSDTPYVNFPSSVVFVSLNMYLVYLAPAVF